MRKFAVLVPAAGLVLALTGTMATAAPAGAALTGTVNTTWKAQPTPTLPHGYAGLLTGISCPAASDCWAVGYEGNLSTGSVAYALAEHWNGTAWALQAIPSPTGQTILYSVSCTSATSCEAAGDSENASGADRTLAEHWNGKTWTVQATPTPGPGAALLDVTCRTPADCTAVGAAPPESGTSVTLAEHWNGKTWTVQPTPKLPQGSNLLDGVSCPSATSCLVTGSTDPPGSPYFFPLAERWNGKTWTVLKAANPGGKHGSGLDGLACTSTTACTAVGQAGTPQGASIDALAEHWNGKTWAVQNTHVSGSGPYLSRVACLSATDCTAVGAGPDAISILAEHWNGKTWTTQTTPNPGSLRNVLGDVSCTATHCLAVGYSMNGNAPKPLAEIS